jgi:hypothetical protein
MPTDPRGFRPGKGPKRHFGEPEGAEANSRDAAQCRVRSGVRSMGGAWLEQATSTL